MSDARAIAGVAALGGVAWLTSPGRPKWRSSEQVAAVQPKGAECTTLYCAAESLPDAAPTAELARDYIGAWLSQREAIERAARAALESSLESGGSPKADAVYLDRDTAIDQPGFAPQSIEAKSLLTIRAEFRALALHAGILTGVGAGVTYWAWADARAHMVAIGRAATFSNVAYVFDGALGITLGDRVAAVTDAVKKAASGAAWDLLTSDAVLFLLIAGVAGVILVRRFS